MAKEKKKKIQFKHGEKLLLKWSDEHLGFLTEDGKTCVLYVGDEHCQDTAVYQTVEDYGLGEFNKTIEDLKPSLVVSESEIEDFNESFRKKNSELAEFSKTISELSDVITEKSNENQALEKQNELLQEKIKEFEKTLSEQNTESIKKEAFEELILKGLKQ